MAEDRSNTDAPPPQPPPPARRPDSGAIVGCGVIGAGWAARLRLNRVPVRVYDPGPDIPRILDEVWSQAVTAWEELGLPTDTAGSLTVCDSVGDAVEGAELIQESVPETLELKCRVLGQIDEAADSEAIIGSSTSGLRCSLLGQSLANPERLVVAHPFNPVYLLPLVEVVGGEQTSAETIERAMAAYRGLGMKPLHVRVEIDAHIADRLLEAVWRESLWLVNDGVATTEEIDDAIRYGFGLRWAQMGVFETYRIAGGEGGFGHFMSQFGPTLSWPWTKLMDTPELTDELIGHLETQSDAQSGAHTIRELERLRDRNLVAIMAALEANDWGAGQSVASMRDLLD
ncbi:MAG: L-carnitine dehydrogenase [Actinomycetia bacterium]|nr:L-carnitine dehydrogenase [Actinomycetes bacterium]